ncbi:MAG TPA: DUF3617 family protein [Solimonas sp.]
MKQAQLRVVARALGIMLLASAATATAADKPREGLWRYTMKMDMGNIATPSISQADLARLPPEIRAKIPQFNGKQMSMDYEHCLTEQDMVPQQQKAHEHCTVTKMDHHGNRVDWSSSCDTPHGKMNATGTATYSGNTMTATTHMTGTSDDGKPIDMTQNITGQYVGACPKE